MHIQSAPGACSLGMACLTIFSGHMDMSRSLGPLVLKPHGRGCSNTLHGTRITLWAASA